MRMPHPELKEGSTQENPEYEEKFEWETLNSMVPLWQRKKADVKKEEYDEFYQQRFADSQPPLSVITVSAEGAVTYKALLFIPEKAPLRYYSEEFEGGLQLYSAGVMIMDKCKELLPECFNFVRGVVESPDLNLNISRELLQHDRQLKLIGANLEKRSRPSWSVCCGTNARSMSPSGSPSVARSSSAPWTTTARRRICFRI